MSDLLYKIDLTQALAAFDQIGAADARLRAEAERTGAAAKQSFTDAARAALEYQQRLAAAQGEVRQAGAVYNELKGLLASSAREAKDLEKSLKTAGGAATEAGQRIKADLAANKQQQAALRVEIDLTRKAIDEEAAAVARVRQQQQQQVAQQRMGTAAARDATTEARRQASEARAAAAETRNAAKQAQQRVKEEEKATKAQAAAARAAGLLTQYERQLTDLVEKRARATTRAEVQGYTKQIKDTRQQIGELKGEANSTGGALGGMFGRFAGAAGAAAAVAIVVSVVKDLAQQAIEAGKRADATLSKLQFARGNDTEKAAQDMAMLRFEADRLGLDIEQAGASYGSFTAAAAAANLPLAEARRLYLAVGGAASVLKLSSDDTQGSLRALQQMVSKGTVSAEELRGQLGERLPGAFSIAAKAIGKTEAELGKMLQRGEVLATDFLPKFARELEKTFGDGTAQAADLLQANTNRIDNEWQRFLLRFTSSTGTAVSAIARFSKQANNFLDGLSPSGRVRLAAQKAAEEAKAFSRIYDAVARQAEVDAKKTGANPVKAVEAAFEREAAQLKRDLAAAEKKLKPLDTTTPEGDANIRRAVIKGEGDAFLVRENRALKEVALLKAQQTILEDVRAARAKNVTDEARQDGLLEALYLRRSKLTQQRKDELKEERILEKGGLNDQLEAVQKQIERLEGKVEKGPKKAKGPDYLKQLLAEEERLRKDAAKKELDLLKDNGEARAEEQYRQALEEVQRTEEKLRKLEKLAGRDGKIDGVQAAALAQLRAAAADAYLAELQRIALAYSDKLFALREDSTQKELLAIERKYDREAQAARGQTQLLLAIEEARQRELQAARQRQAQQQIEKSSEIQKDAAVFRGTIYGEGTGRSIIEAKRKEKEDLIKIDIEKNRALLNNSLLLAGEQGEIVRSALQTQIAVYTEALNKIEVEKKRHVPEDFIYRLILGKEGDGEEGRKAVDDAIAQTLSAINTILQAEQEAAAAKVAAKSRQIDELQRELDRELEYNAAGSASNVGKLREQIKAEKEARRESLADQKKAARQQQAIQDLTAVSSIAQAVANIIAGWSSVPFVGSLLGIAAAGAMVAAFVSTKARAKNAAQSNGEGFFTGGFTGGQSRYEERGVVHGREFVHTADVTEKYRHSLFEPLHKGRPDLIDWSARGAREILPDFTLPARMQAERQAATELKVVHQFAPLQVQFDAMQRELAAIRAHTGTTAQRHDVVPIEEGYMTVDPVTRSTHTVRLRQP